MFVACYKNFALSRLKLEFAMLATKLLPLLLLLTVSAKDYSGYKLYQVTPKKLQHVETLNSFESVEGINFWSKWRMVDKPIDVMVSTEHQTEFLEILHSKGIHSKVLIEDMQKVIMEEKKNNMRTQDEEVPSFDRYLRYEEIQAYLEYLEAEYPDIVTISTPAITYEGRELKMITISTGGNGTKPAILSEGGIHAREWIAPAMALYIIQQLVEEPKNREMIELVDWYIIPVLNPDGYEYTHTDDRFWRKTRSLGERCNGVDGNRNMGFHWGEVGVSALDCSEIYGGKNAFSEAETAGFAKVVQQYAEQVKVYVSIHSYGPYVIYPWGYSADLPDGWQNSQALGEEVGAAIHAVNGTEYLVGNVVAVTGYSAGSTDDYVKGVGGVDLSFCLEMPGGGSKGFDPPPESILPIVTETWEGIKVFYNAALN